MSIENVRFAGELLLLLPAASSVYASTLQEFTPLPVHAVETFTLTGLSQSRGNHGVTFPVLYALPKQLKGPDNESTSSTIALNPTVCQDPAFGLVIEVDGVALSTFKI